MKQMISHAERQPIGASLQMPLSIRQRSDAEARLIFDAIKGSVIEGESHAGDRLPPEKGLCDQFSASRHTVRKAMTMLEKEGFVVRHVGRGTFILDPRSSKKSGNGAPSWSHPDGRGWTLSELTEARLIIEPQLAAMVVERAGADDFAAMKACIEAIGAATDWPTFKEAKYAFHLAMTRAAGNDFLNAVFEQIIESRRQDAWSRHHSAGIEMEGTKAVCVAESQAIIDALVARDVVGAREAIQKSLIRILVAVNEL